MTTATTTPTLPVGVDPFTPLPSRTISDTETLKALSEPIRLRILEVMVADGQSDWTVKQVAKALGVGPTKLYHHVRILEDAELIRPSGQQLVRGIVETRYRIGQLELRLDRRLFSTAGDEFRSTARATVGSIFDIAREDHLAATEHGLGDDPSDPDAPSLIGLTRTHVRVSRARAIELKDRLTALIREFDTEDDHSEITLSVFLSLHPAVDPKTLGHQAGTEPG